MPMDSLKIITNFDLREDYFIGKLFASKLRAVSQFKLT